MNVGEFRASLEGITTKDAKLTPIEQRNFEGYEVLKFEMPLSRTDVLARVDSYYTQNNFFLRDTQGSTLYFANMGGELLVDVVGGNKNASVIVAYKPQDN